jgi:hypothetical protein
MMWAPVRRPSNHVVHLAGLSVLALALVVSLARFLRGFSHLPGTDAYYYALQAQSILDIGRLKVPDHGSVEYLVAAMAHAGLSIETAFRFVLTMVFGLYQIGMLLVVLQLREKARFGAALLWALSAPLVAFHTIEFPNLTLGLATIPLWFWLAIRPIRYRMLWLGALLGASALVHPAAGVIALLFVTMASLGIARSRGSSSPMRSFSIPMMIVAGCAGLLIILALARPAVAARVLSVDWGRPALLGLAISHDVPDELKSTILALWTLLAVLLLLAVYRRTSSSMWKVMAVAALALPLFPDNSAGLAEIGGRLSVLFVLLALPLGALIWNEVAPDQPAEHAFVSWLHSAQAKRCIAVVVTLAAILMPTRMKSYNSLLMTDDYGAYENVVVALRDAKLPMLIAHRGLDFFYSYRLRQDAFHFDPEPGWNRSAIWRVAARITPEEVAYYSPPACLWGQTANSIDGTGYLIVREDCWEELRARLTRSENPDLYIEVWENMENPSQPRPAFLHDKHPDAGSDPFPVQ